MPRAKSGGLRKLWLDIHMWLGVGLFIVIIPITLSGAVLVWDQQIERAIHADRFEISGEKAQLAPSAYLDAATKAFDGRAAPTNLRFPGKAGDPVTVTGRMDGPMGPNGRPRQMTAWIDPKSGEVLDTADIGATLFSTLHRVHGSLMIPEIGRKVVGWIGWCLTLSAVTGLVLWWPRKGSVARGLRWKRTPSVMDNLHHIIGFWVCVPLAILALTGVYISFPQTSRALFGVAQAQPAQKGGQQARNRATPPPLKTTLTSIDDAATSALSKAQGYSLAVITLPTEGKTPSWRIQLTARDAKPLNLQLADGELEPTVERGGGGGGGGGRVQDPVSKFIRQTHDGAETPIIWQIIIVLGGLAPSVLGVTGLVMWARRQLRKAALRKPELQPAE